MKRFFGVLLVAFITVKSGAQSPAEQIANKIAQKMKDTLQLTDGQRIQVYEINIQLAQQKTALQSQYTNTDSLRVKMQLVENTRDGLYQAILSEDKYLLYRQKKRNLVNNN